MAPTTSAPVLVTGPTGFIGAHVALDLLQHGYRVRGTVRSQKKFDQLVAQPEFAKYRDHFEAVVVEDLATGDFSEAVKGVEVVIHTASPNSLGAENPEETFLKPAIEGTKNVVNAAVKSGTVRNIVVTSSLGAVFSMDDGLPFPEPAPRTYTDKDWNKATYEEAVQSSMPGFAYSASKVLAEQAAYDVVKQSGKPIKVTTLCPPLVFGPYVHVVDKLANLGESLDQLWHVVSGRCGKDVPQTFFPALTDVRTLATAHRLAFERDQEGRFLISNGAYDWAQAVDVARKYFPEQAKNTPDPKDSDRILGNPKLFKLDNTKSKELLGLEYGPVEEVLKDTIGHLYQEREQGK
ncbi:unnamed protein product [Tilletia controversa]|uniref:3-beta hydroxysteroid dehydrogenase/isomerase domain-containing protein n=3 Tax=Tilletia TaxID=13289 RepID=A0A8X7T070_9BASI|nr:hypothetical protein CF336_g1043 [Tilletia laevis]KAE8204621.1 hypothetical protein CF328_g972 [Tilletia controversa]KAE8262615.1 hypothetical protein A4X03_0g2317 [Tilletia caries]KAE8205939.1 hypothetical protein CF335_g2136 [Tilletia laevis]KAE8253538.1 hypothetical protein A4X06_0g1390 [Tilletia controversa]